MGSGVNGDPRRQEGVMKRVPAVILSLVLTACVPAAAPEPLVITSAPEIVVITTTPRPPVVVVVTATAPPEAEASEPSPSPTAACRKAASVTLEDAGQEIAVCGLIIDVGKTTCASCPHDKIFYLVLKGGMRIISYDWEFLSSFPYEGICTRVVDEVEELAGRPVFVLGMAEGYAGVACQTGPGGVPVCESGSYLEFVDQSMCY